MSVLGPGFTRNVWMFLYKEGGRWAPCELKNCEIGYEGVNLAEMDANDPEPLTWEQYLRRDIRVLLDCDGIALLPGWERSRGAQLEAHIAHALGMRPMYLTLEPK
jgi:hypothetical protein